MTISDKLNYLSETKTAIKNAIIEKGIEVSDTDTFRSYAEKISSIPSGGSSGCDDDLGSFTLGKNLEIEFTGKTLGAEYTIPDGVTVFFDWETDIANAREELTNQVQAKYDTIMSSDLSDNEKEQELEKLAKYYERENSKLEIYLSLNLAAHVGLLLQIFKNSNECKTFNSNQLTQINYYVIPESVEYVFLPEVIVVQKDRIFGDNITPIFPFTAIKEFNAPKITNITLKSWFSDSPIETLYLNPQGTLGDITYMCQNCYNLTNITLPTITDDSILVGAFSGCTSITSTKNLFTGVTTINSEGRKFYETFRDCTSLLATGLDDLQIIKCGSSYMDGLQRTFIGCTNLTSTGLNNLREVQYHGLDSTFQECINLTNEEFASLNTIGDYALQDAFHGCTNLTSLSFPALNSNSFGSSTTQFIDMLQGVTGCTVHFPSNLESVIGSWSDVTSGFGGTNTTVLFDLPATT